MDPLGGLAAIAFGAGAWALGFITLPAAAVVGALAVVPVVRSLRERRATASFGIDDTKLQLNVLMVGNPGTGKSALLNGLTRHNFFKSGVSFGSGLTFELQKETHEGTRYMDTPGLADDEKRKQAAEAITEALRLSGRYKVFFVCVLNNGRVRPEDATTIRLVLDATKGQLSHFGVIVNQVPPVQYQQLIESLPRADDANAPWVLVAQSLLKGLTPEQKRGCHFCFNVRDPDLESKNNVMKPVTADLRRFVDELPAVKVLPKDVDDVKEHEFQALQTKLEKDLDELRKDIVRREREFDEERRNFAVLRERIALETKVTTWREIYSANTWTWQQRLSELAELDRLGVGCTERQSIQMEALMTFETEDRQKQINGMTWATRLARLEVLAAREPSSPLTPMEKRELAALRKCEAEDRKQKEESQGKALAASRGAATGAVLGVVLGAPGVLLGATVGGFVGRALHK